MQNCQISVAWHPYMVWILYADPIYVILTVSWNTWKVNQPFHSLYMKYMLTWKMNIKFNSDHPDIPSNCGHDRVSCSTRFQNFNWSYIVIVNAKFIRPMILPNFTCGQDIHKFKLGYVVVFDFFLGMGKWYIMLWKTKYVLIITESQTEKCYTSSNRQQMLG